MVTRRRIASAVALATICLAFVPGSSDARSSKKDHAVGAGQNNPPAPATPRHFGFVAQSTGVGDAAKGKILFTTAGLERPPIRTFTADVKCLRVEGNLATMVGVIDRTKNNDHLQGRTIVAWVQDVGRGEDGEDRIQNSIRPAGETWTSCPDPVVPQTNDILRGNINLFDAGL